MDLSQLDPSLLAEFYNWQQQVQDGAIETVAPSAVAPPPAKSAAPAPPRGSAPLKLTVKLNINSKAVNQEQQERLRALASMGVHHVQNENEKIRIKFIVNGRVVAAPRVEWKYIAKAAVEASKKRSRESSQVDASSEWQSENMQEISEEGEGEEEEEEVEDVRPAKRMKLERPPRPPSKSSRRKRMEEEDMDGGEMDSAEDSFVSDDDEAPPAKRGRGRPKKEERVVDDDRDDDDDEEDEDDGDEGDDDGDDDMDEDDEGNNPEGADDDSQSEVSREVIAQGPRTARQRAMVKAAVTKKAKPIVKKPEPKNAHVKNMSEKEQKKRENSNRRRMLRELEKMEEEKNLVVAQLLNKLDTKKSDATEPKPPRTDVMRWISTIQGTRYQLPSDQSALAFLKDCYLVNPPKPSPKSLSASMARSNAKCAAPGCGNTRKYTVSQVGLPACSLECYKVLTLRNK